MSHSSSSPVSDSSLSPSYEFKIVLLGSSSAGKTSLLSRFTRNFFTSNLSATIGAAFVKKIIEIDGEKVILHIWDTGK